VIISLNPVGEWAIMIVFVLELFAGVCAFSTIAFIGLASVSKLRPDLDEELGVDLGILRLTEDHLIGHRGAVLDLDGVIDEKMRNVAPKEAKSTPRAASGSLIIRLRPNRWKALRQ
jgi:hypothetical protein